MATQSNLADYKKQIEKLEGNDFEAEVCARLQSIFVDFQRVPAKPHGDGGLDGLSHGQERAYCCYGPEQDVRKLDNKGLKEEIVKKFSSDLRTLCELKHEKRKLVLSPSAELKTILGENRKIKHVYLVVSWFESHRVIGPLNTAFEKYKYASDLRFLESDSTITIWGPEDLSNLGDVDDHSLFRIQNRALMACVRAASAEQISEARAGDFEDKFNDLKNRRPGAATKIDEIALDLRQAWAAAIALDNDLAKNSLGLHEMLETVRSDSALSAKIKSMSESNPYDLINTMQKEIAGQLEKTFGNRLGALLPRITQGLVAGLIGECPIDWREDHV